MDYSTATSLATGWPASRPSHTSIVIAATFPRSHNMAASQNTRAKSTFDTIKSLAENDGDPNIEVTIRDTTLDDTSVSTINPSWL
jgi:hypothetical protein